MRRYNNILHWFQKRNGLVTVDYARGLAMSRVNVGGLCDRFTGVKGGTLWSWVYTLGGTAVLVSDGPPCKNDYQTLSTHFKINM